MLFVNHFRYSNHNQDISDNVRLYESQKNSPVYNMTSSSFEGHAKAACDMWAKFEHLWVEFYGLIDSPFWNVITQYFIIRHQSTYRQEQRKSSKFLSSSANCDALSDVVDCLDVTTDI